MGSFLLSLITFVAFFFAPVTASLTTRYEIGPGRRMREYSYAGTGSGSQPSVAHKPSATNWLAVDLPILADATATGGGITSTNTLNNKPGVKYASICIPNPLKRMGTGTGTTYFNTGTGMITRLTYVVRKNPNAAVGSIGFVGACNAGTGNMIPLTCSSSGCIQSVASGSGSNATNSTGLTKFIWPGDAFLKLGLTTDPGAGFRASIITTVTGLDTLK